LLRELIEKPLRFVVPPQQEITQRQLVAVGKVRRLKAARLFEMRKRAIELLLAKQQGSQVEMRSGVAGTEAQYGLELVLGFLRPILPRIVDSEVHAQIGGERLPFGRDLKVPSGFFDSAQQIEYAGQRFVYVRMLRILLRQIRKQLFGTTQPLRLNCFNCAAELLRIGGR